MTNFQRINLPLRSETRSRITKLVARWQSGMETLSGCGLPKLRLEFASSTSRAGNDLKPQEQCPSKAIRVKPRHIALDTSARDQR